MYLHTKISSNGCFSLSGLGDAIPSGRGAALRWVFDREEEAALVFAAGNSMLSRSKSSSNRFDDAAAVDVFFGGTSFSSLLVGCGGGGVTGDSSASVVVTSSSRRGELAPTVALDTSLPPTICSASAAAATASSSAAVSSASTMSLFVISWDGDRGGFTSVDAAAPQLLVAPAGVGLLPTERNSSGDVSLAVGGGVTVAFFLSTLWMITNSSSSSSSSSFAPNVKCVMPMPAETDEDAVAASAPRARPGSWLLDASAVGWWAGTCCGVSLFDASLILSEMFRMNPAPHDLNPSNFSLSASCVSRVTSATAVVVGTGVVSSFSARFFAALTRSSSSSSSESVCTDSTSFACSSGMSILKPPSTTVMCWKWLMTKCSARTFSRLDSSTRPRPVPITTKCEPRTASKRSMICWRSSWSKPTLGPMCTAVGRCAKLKLRSARQSRTT
eukprot:PhM_4_TR16621/c0_g1_i1/m.59454